MRFKSSIAGSSEGSCGISFPWMAVSSILTFISETEAHNEVVISSIRFTDSRLACKRFAIRFCSFAGGIGIWISLIVFTDNPG